MSAHTKGPWEVVHFKPGGSRKYDDVFLTPALYRGWRLASVNCNSHAGGVELGLANAAVLAAAPDMLDALRLIAKLNEGFEPDSARGIAHEIARAAITRATGGSHAE